MTTTSEERPIIGQTFIYDMFSEHSAQRDYYERTPPQPIEAVLLPYSIADFAARITSLESDLETAQHESLPLIHTALKAANTYNAATNVDFRTALELKHAMQHATEAANTAKAKIALVRSEIRRLTAWLQAETLRLEQCREEGLIP